MHFVWSACVCVDVVSYGWEKRGRLLFCVLFMGVLHPMAMRGTSLGRESGCGAAESVLNESKMKFEK